jgi:hypothetical protein
VSTGIVEVSGPSSIPVVDVLGPSSTVVEVAATSGTTVVEVVSQQASTLVVEVVAQAATVLVEVSPELGYPGPRGPQGVQGVPGATPDLFVYASAGAVTISPVIAHNLGHFPVIEVIDSGGDRVVLFDAHFPTVNTVFLTFLSAVAFTATFV